jgi:hypothetical protein
MLRNGRTYKLDTDEPVFINYGKNNLTIVVR